MKTLYFVYVGCGTDLLLSEDKVLINNYSDSTDTYNAFEQTAQIVSAFYGGTIKERSLAEEHYTIVDDMFEAITPEEPSDKHIAKYIMENSFVKEYE